MHGHSLAPADHILVERSSHEALSIDALPITHTRTESMSNRDEQPRAGGQQDGKPARAEGQHGDKTHARFQEQLHEGRSAPADSDQDRERHEQSAYEGKRRLVEDREQHDEAERNSEKVRLTKDRERGRDDGPSDNTSSLRGVLDHREHRADYQERDSDGFRRDR